MSYRRCGVLGLPFRRRYERIQILPEVRERDGERERERSRARARIREIDKEIERQKEMEPGKRGRI